MPSSFINVDQEGRLELNAHFKSSVYMDSSSMVYL